MRGSEERMWGGKEVRSWRENEEVMGGRIEVRRRITLGKNCDRHTGVQEAGRGCRA